MRLDSFEARRRLPKLVSIIALGLSGCGASDVMQAGPSTYTVSAKEGLPTGGWPTAQRDAIEKGTQYCASKGQHFSLVNEDRTGTPGFTLLTSTITFACGADLAEEKQAVEAKCAGEMQSAASGALQGKIDVNPSPADAPPTFEIASNRDFPTAADRLVIARWATARDRCVRGNIDLPLPAGATGLNKAIVQQDRAFGTEAAARVGELILALYDGKLTYGEFAQKRYEINRDAAAAERQFRAATLIADHERQVEAKQAAQQQFQNNLIAWSAYMQSVTARQPQTVIVGGAVDVHVRANCTHMVAGNLVTTNCY